MKALIITIALFAGFGTIESFAQDTTKTVNTAENYSKITKNDGTTFVGIILSQDLREVIIETEKLGKLAIPKHEIASIEKINNSDIKKNGEVYSRNLHPSRYSISTNGIPIKKGEGYAKFMPLGVDFQLPLTDKWSIGGIASWGGFPLIVTSKYSFELAQDINASVGFLYGNMMHASLLFGERYFTTGGGIGFGNITLGDDDRNLNLGAGYGFVHFERGLGIFGESKVAAEGTGMFTLGGMYRIADKAILIFDSISILSGGSIYYWINPGVRYMPKPENIWQFGVNVLGQDDFVIPFPIPSVSFTKVF